MMRKEGSQWGGGSGRRFIFDDTYQIIMHPKLQYRYEVPKR